MFKLTSKKQTLVFLEIEDLMLYVVNSSSKLFKNGAFIKISPIDDFCEEYLVEDLKK